MTTDLDACYVLIMQLVEEAGQVSVSTEFVVNLIREKSMDWWKYPIVDWLGSETWDKSDFELKIPILI